MEIDRKSMEIYGINRIHRKSMEINGIQLKFIEFCKDQWKSIEIN